jgi:iron(III) transport system ATP-binding protein
MEGIVLKEVSITYGTLKVLDNLNFALETGERIVIIGPSGCGKTTLLRLIAGLEMPEKGEIRIEGRVVSKPGWILPPNKRNLGFVFQAPSLWPHMTVEQNILFGLARHPEKNAHERLKEMMEKTSTSHLTGRFPDQISGGEARRVSIARALAPSPGFLLMDEPLTNLDKPLKKGLLAMINKLVEDEKLTLLYVTHDHEEASFITNRILTLKDGKKLE